MKLLEEISKAIKVKYEADTLYTVDKIQMYLDHVPQSVSYPIICVYHEASNNKYAMVTDDHPIGYDYVFSDWRFSIYGNDRNYTQMMDICDRLEDLYHKQSLTLGNNCTHIVTLVKDARTKFYDQNQKIWSIHQKYTIWAGK